MTDIFILLCLILASGFLALAEMSIGASRPANLEAARRERKPGAEAALRLRERPSRLLAGTQLGITALAMASGIFGESLWAERLRQLIDAHVPALSTVSYPIALTVVVCLITYVSLVIGEVVPRRIGLSSPERIAMVCAWPLSVFMKLLAPFIDLVSRSSDALTRLVPRSVPEATAFEEIRALVTAGRESGDLGSGHGAIIANALRLDDRRAAAIMTPAASVVRIDLRRSREDNMKVLLANESNRLVVCKGSLDEPIGWVSGVDLLKARIRDESPVLDFGSLSPRPLRFVPASLPLLDLLEFFRANGTNIALVVNEFGSVEGVVTSSDLLGAVIGESVAGASESPLANRREDGSWLLDGLLPVDEMKEILAIRELLPDEETKIYHTVGGFVLCAMGRVPRKTDTFACAGWIFEIVDMDHARVDEVIARRVEITP
jgi:putative hemolysin